MERTIQRPSISESECEPEPEFEPEPYSIPNPYFRFDINMLNYSTEDDNGFTLDWNKLVYNDDQITDFVKEKNHKDIKPEAYDYLFNPEPSEWEKAILKEKGVQVPECREKKDILLVSSVLRDA